MIDDLKPLIGKLTIFAKDRLGFEHPPKLFLKKDTLNSQLALGKTAYYDPQEKAVTLFTHSRHPKDILRSFAHELVHHVQNLRGDLSPEKMGTMHKNYAQDNEHMRNMEEEAYLQGNMCFRDWEDSLENKDKLIIKIAESKYLKENKKMATKITEKLLKDEIRKILIEQTTGGSALDAIKKSDTLNLDQFTDKEETEDPEIPELEPDLEVGDDAPKGSGIQVVKTIYGFVPDLNHMPSFAKAYNLAREMKVPYFKFDRHHRKYNVFAAGKGRKPRLSKDQAQSLVDAWDKKGHEDLVNLLSKDTPAAAPSAAPGSTGAGGDTGGAPSDAAAGEAETEYELPTVGPMADAMKIKFDNSDGGFFQEIGKLVFEWDPAKRRQLAKPFAKRFKQEFAGQGSDAVMTTGVGKKYDRRSRSVSGLLSQVYDNLLSRGTLVFGVDATAVAPDVVEKLLKKGKLSFDDLTDDEKFPGNPEMSWASNPAVLKYYNSSTADEVMQMIDNRMQADQMQKDALNPPMDVWEKINTPEKENLLYENRFSKRNSNLFNQLVKQWTK